MPLETVRCPRCGWELRLPAQLVGRAYCANCVLVPPQAAPAIAPPMKMFGAAPATAIPRGTER